MSEYRLFGPQAYGYDLRGLVGKFRLRLIVFGLLHVFYLPECEAQEPQALVPHARFDCKTGSTFLVRGSHDPTSIFRAAMRSAELRVSA